MRQALAPTLIAVLLLLPRLGGGEPRSFSPDEVRQLEAGEVLTEFRRTASAGEGWAAALVKARPEQAFKVIADVARYREFMDRVVESRVVGGSGVRYRFFYKIDMPWPLADHWCTTDNVHEVNRVRQVYARRWKLVEGTFHRNEGAWVASSWPGGRTLLTYSVILLPKSRAPRRLIDYASRVALPRGVRTMRKRVEELLQAKRL